MKHATTRLDKNRIWKMTQDGASVTQISGVTQVDRANVEGVIAAFKDGRLKPPHSFAEPKSVISVAQETINSQHAEIDALKAQLEAAKAQAELTQGQKAAATRAKNKAASELEKTFEQDESQVA